MAAVTGLLEWVFALYFLTHIPITLLIDLQALVPGAGIHPQSVSSCQDSLNDMVICVCLQLSAKSVRTV